MLHTSAIFLCSALALFALCASIYVIVFAIIGILIRTHHAPGESRTRFLVFVPAHNEGTGIRATLRSLQNVRYPAEQIRTIVIADNCEDDTAELARSCGVEVWVRSDPHHRGKGRALAWGLERADFHFDLVAVIDADTEVDAAFFSEMDSAYAALMRNGGAEAVFQGRYLFGETSSGSSWFEEFTLASKAAENSYCYRPRSALGLANLIQGNGFCISRAALARVPFKAFSIVEDAEYAIALALLAIPVLYVDSAQVVSRMTLRVKDAMPQRLRWASGIFGLIFRSVPELLVGAVRKRAWRPAEMALMLLLTSRLLIVYVSFLTLVLMSIMGWTYFPAIALVSAFVLQLAYLVLVFRKADSKPARLQAILWMPLYVGLIGAVQVGALLGLKRKQWNRTAR